MYDGGSIDDGNNIKVQSILILLSQRCQYIKGRSKCLRECANQLGGWMLMSESQLQTGTEICFL